MHRLKRKTPEKLREVSKKSHIEGEDSENAPVTERFQFDCNADELQKFKEGDCPKNTAKNNEWALRNFHAWRVARNEQHGSDDQCPENVLMIRAKPATNYASSCVKLEGLMDKNIHHAVFTCF